MCRRFVLRLSDRDLSEDQFACRFKLQTLATQFSIEETIKYIAGEETAKRSRPAIQIASCAAPAGRDSLSDNRAAERFGVAVSASPSAPVDRADLPAGAHLLAADITTINVLSYNRVSVPMRMGLINLL
jgi:hypothetical protein